MALPTKHIRSQGPVIKMLGATALTALRRSITGSAPSGPIEVPSPEFRATLSPRPRALIRDYVRFCGGDPSSYKHTLPPHLWPQWGFPLAAKTLVALPYPMFKVLNGGCRVEVKGTLANDEPLEVSARLVNIDENERRAVLEQQVVTGTAANPEAIVATMYAIVPLARPERGGGNKARKQPERVPVDAEELARWKLPADAGLAFALLTGDFNPVHWIPPYARAFGFRNTILHGFASMAKAWEGLVRARYGGSPTAIRSFDVKFTKPLTLPAKVGLYLQTGEDQDQVWIAAAPGASPYLAGTVRGSFDR
ncbi:MaoC like domain protein [Enhygromyxa salina]|uniref:MaoC like domain protein n=1 Tax=Enhygromyxa salina TaxID=215803 RepID=A0A2S9Y1W8_9BACT|nr:MaoC/PaaZ C-terminal domain-containing protein [Enhygromyxa salina]PRP99076.1 MaoC like domain protein [Enhygromyxa salina]